MNREKVSKGVLTIALIAALFTSLNAAIDNYIVRSVITSQDQITAASFYLVVGSWVYIICVLICNKIFGKQLDPEYPGFTFGTRNMHKYAALSGIFGATSTLFYLRGSQMLDPSLILILGCCAVFYMAMYDVIKKNIKGKNILLPASLVILGSIMASIQHISDNIKITVWGVVLIAIVCSGLNAFGDGTRKKGVKSADAVTFSLWRFIWLSAVATILVPSLALIRGKFCDLLEMRSMLNLNAFVWIAITMVLASLYNVLSQKALKFESLTVVFLLINSKIAMGVPITAIGNILSPGAFGNGIPEEWTSWAMRSAGAIVTFLGVFYLRKKK
ncbi:MAG: hypothetical protein M1127_03530 [Patescibacteria group bacterium]|nr:hypothetical protein [Patescibacteria group bacterium]